MKKTKLLQKATEALIQEEYAITEKIVDYFRECFSKEIVPQKAGLLEKMAISREQWSEIVKKFPRVGNRADHLIEKVWVEKLLSPNASGATFYLKNTFRDLYQDKSSQDITLRTPKPLLEGVEPIKLPPEKKR